MTTTVAAANDDVTPRRRYYGYIPDLLRALSALLDFRYELYLVSDGSYGFRKSQTQWTGMIGELVNGVTICTTEHLIKTHKIHAVLSYADQ